MTGHAITLFKSISIAASMTFFSSLIFAADDDVAISASPARSKVVLELFTSQGCSSCPPADRILEKLAQQPNVVALSRPVQYWDKLGWKDTLATPENTQLQYAYAKTWRKSGVYTPQLIIDGAVDVVGNQENTILQRIEEFEQKNGVIVKTTSQADGSIVITLSGDVSTRAEIHLLWLRASTLVLIGRGENSNSRVRYVNAVTADKIIGEWSGGTKTLAISSPDLRKNSADRWAILVQEPGPGHILGADYIHYEPIGIKSSSR